MSSNPNLQRFDVSCDNCSHQAIVIQAVEAQPPQFCTMCGSSVETPEQPLFEEEEA